jgi:hypothetical protein
MHRGEKPMGLIVGSTDGPPPEYDFRRSLQIADWAHSQNSLCFFVNVGNISLWLNVGFFDRSAFQKQNELGGT